MDERGVGLRTVAGAPQRVVAGTPHWAEVATRIAAWSVVPSAVWRTAVGFGCRSLSETAKITSGTSGDGRPLAVG